MLAERKKAVVEAFGQNAEDTGSISVQIALLDARIKGLQEHFSIHKHDHHSRRGLLAVVERRKRLVKYLKRKNYEQYSQLIQALKLRR